MTAIPFGVLPSGWRMGRIKDLVGNAANGVWGDEPVGDGRDVYCVRAADFDRDALTVRRDKLPLRRVDPRVLRKHRLRRGDLVWEKSGGGETQPVGLTVMFDLSDDAVCSNFCTKLSPKAGTDPRYLAYVFAAAYAAGLNQRSIKQTTGLQNLDGKAFLAESWPIPDFEEQRRIANFLDEETYRLDTTATLRQRQLLLVDERRRAAVQEIFAESLSGAMTKVKYLLAQRPTYGVLVPEFVEDGVPFIRIQDLGHLQQEGLELKRIPRSLSAQYRRTNLRTGDVLVSVVGTLGRAAIVPQWLEGANVNRAIACLRVAPFVDRRLLVAWLATRHFEIQALDATASDSAQRTLGMGDLSNFILRWPQDPQEQLRMSAEVAEVDRGCDAIRVSINRQIRLLAERRRGLIIGAVTGQISLTTAQGAVS